MLKLSIVTVCKNAVATIRRTIDSVLEQSFRNVEYIVIDGASTDGTAEQVESYGTAIQYFESKNDAGLYYAMNRGLELCTGDLIGIINADDWYEPGAFEQVAEVFRSLGQQTILYGAIRCFRNGRWDQTVHYSHEQLPRRMIGHPAVFVPAPIYQNYGRFDVRYRVAADYELMVRYFKNGIAFHAIPSVLANFTEGGLSSVMPIWREGTNIRRSHGYISGQALVYEKLRNIARDMKYLIHR